MRQWLTAPRSSFRAFGSFPLKSARRQQAAAEAGLVLRPRRARCFDEVHDIAAFDLVLVMDRYDFTEVRARLRFQGFRSSL